MQRFDHVLDHHDRLLRDPDSCVEGIYGLATETLLGKRGDISVWLKDKLLKHCQHLGSQTSQITLEAESDDIVENN